MRAQHGTRRWLGPAPATIPQGLLDRPQWVTWRAVLRAGRWTKPPLDPNTGRLASVGDPGTWTTFDRAWQVYRHARTDGVGYVFCTEDPFTGIDLDAMNDEAWTIVNELRTYTEYSPSGRGVHIIVEAVKPGGGCRRGSIEMYDRERFLAITGCLVAGVPATIRRRQSELEQLHTRLFATTSVYQHVRQERVDSMLSDHAVIERAQQARNGERFWRLWVGDWSGFRSASEADWQLCLYLAYWTNGDPGAVDRLFRQSGLMRPKWDEPHFAGGVTYGERTVARAVRRALPVPSTPS